MKSSIRREPDAPASEMAAGRCPGASHGPGSDCPICRGRGIIAYSIAWTPDEDAALKRLAEEGRPFQYAALEIRKPLSAVYARLRNSI